MARMLSDRGFVIEILASADGTSGHRARHPGRRHRLRAGDRVGLRPGRPGGGAGARDGRLMGGRRTLLSDRSRTLFAIIAAAAQAGAVTPSTAELDGDAAGRRPPDRQQSSASIGSELRRLRRAGRVTVIGRARRRIFEIAATGQRTVRRAAPGANATLDLGPGPGDGPPPDGAGGLAAADQRQRRQPTTRRCERREFARHEHPSGSGPGGPDRPAGWSPTGCATAMMRAETIR